MSPNQPLTPSYISLERLMALSLNSVNLLVTAVLILLAAFDTLVFISPNQLLTELNILFTRLIALSLNSVNRLVTAVLMFEAVFDTLLHKSLNHFVTELYISVILFTALSFSSMKRLTTPSLISMARFINPSFISINLSMPPPVKLFMSSKALSLMLPKNSTTLFQMDFAVSLRTSPNLDQSPSIIAATPDII